jgi:hypothetical protein
LYFCNNFTRYNPNANLFAFAQGVVEFSSTSSLIPNYKIRVVNLYRWGRNASYVGVVLELVVFAYISFFFITETRQVLRIGITAYAPSPQYQTVFQYYFNGAIRYIPRSTFPQLPWGTITNPKCSPTPRFPHPISVTISPDT